MKRITRTEIAIETREVLVIHSSSEAVQGCSEQAQLIKLDDGKTGDSFLVVGFKSLLKRFRFRRDKPE